MEGEFESVELQALGRLAYETHTDPLSVRLISHLDAGQLTRRHSATAAV